jgi:uncharacterized protein YrrD
MLKGKSVIGKELLSLAEGVKLDKVHDVVVEPEGRRVVALVVSEGGFMSTSRLVPITEVASFGRDAVVIDSADSIIPASADPTLQAFVERHDKILGKHVYTTTGTDQGSIADIYFEEGTGAVVGYEVTGGMLGDVAKGRSYLATDEISTIGDDVIYVAPHAGAGLDAQVGGLQGTLEGAGQKLGEAKDGAQQRAADASPEERLVGRRTGSDVESDEGSVIVPRGRTVRPADVDAAREAGKLQALSASVALGDAQDAGADAKDAVGAAGDKAGSLWDQFTAKISELTDANGRRMDAAQTKQRLEAIADAIGRPVTKVILDREDNVVLNWGDIITHQAIQRAHESGGLDSLLNSVYKGDAEITKAELRAPTSIEAEATVDKAGGGAAVVEELQSKVEAAERQRELEEEQKRQQAEVDRRAREREREARASERETQRTSRKRASEPDTQPQDASSVEDRSATTV